MYIMSAYVWVYMMVLDFVSGFESIGRSMCYASIWTLVVTRGFTKYLTRVF